MQEKQHPIGAVIGGLAGFVGGMIGLKKALREADKSRRLPQHGLKFDTGGNIALAAGEHVQRLRELTPMGHCPNAVELQKRLRLSEEQPPL